MVICLALPVRDFENAVQIETHAAQQLVRIRQWRQSFDAEVGNRNVLQGILIVPLIHQNLDLFLARIAGDVALGPRQRQRRGSRPIVTGATLAIHDRFLIGKIVLANLTGRCLPSGRTQQRIPPNHVCIYPTIAMASISTRTSRGSLAASIVDRAGGFSEKYFPYTSFILANSPMSFI